ncbi:protein PLASTID MOVEMENT IMPAIRED 1-RELATED 1-like [Arachis stenosperma]|uniref:protein PLASTID MOVEMENT IMPAIRED 1-RELATED 1-like n=1 Tax=Arachis stenosperma TaxID=217475 RepID=UPI0025AC3D6F|nr:protein PLASTID MOVEMENT IMPAIRED 1-RELATED 1-like [Arachis stenosperma]
MEENKSKQGYEEQNGEKSNQGSEEQKRFLRGVESISKALSLDGSSSKDSSSTPRTRSKSIRKAPLPDPKSSPEAGKNDNLRKEKKSIWDSLKALSLSRNRKFECRFSLQVHLIEGLPPSFNDASICVYWKRKRDVMVTHPAKVILGAAEFEQMLTYTCTISGSKSRPQNSAKYEPKHSSLYASMVGAAELDLGKHRVDLTRFLPLTLEELSEEKSSGKWSTSFRLSGAAKGAVMNVSFGYVVVGSHGTIGNQDSPNELGLGQNDSPSAMQLDKAHGLTKTDLLRTGSLPIFSPDYSSQNAEEVMDLHEVMPLPKSASSGDIFHQSPDIEEICSPYRPKDYEENINKPDSPDIENENPKNHQDIEEKTSPHACSKPEYPVFQVNVETVKPEDFPSTNSRDEKHEGCESNGYSVVDKAIEFFSSYERVNLEQSSMKAVVKKHTFNSTNTLDSVAEQVSSQDTVKHDTQEKALVCEFYHQDDLCTQKLPLQEADSALDSVKDLEVVAQVSGQEENPEEWEGDGFSAVDKGIECSSDEHVKLEVCTAKALVDDLKFDSTSILETAVKHDSEDEVNDGAEEKAIVHEFSHKELLLQEIESALISVKDSPMIMEAKTEYKKRNTYSLDDVTGSFLSMLGIDDSPMKLSPKSGLESPRERLVTQFEMDSKSEGFSSFDVDKGSNNEIDDAHKTSIGSEPLNFSNCIKSSSFSEDLHAAHLVQLQHMSKEKTKTLEEMETEALTCELGLNEKAFQHSPPKNNASYESPIHALPEEPLRLPPLAEGLGHCLQTSNGGFLRSMSPSLFKNSRSSGRLVMQISHPVVVPAEMGSGMMEIVQCLALMGIEKLSMLAKKLMPLEDITGKTIQQIAWEAMTIKGKERQCHLQHNLVTQEDTTCVLRGLKGTSSGSVGNQTGSEFVAFEALAPLAMDKIEALAMEGLRIQSGMEETDAPSNITAQSFGDISALHAKGNNSNESDEAVALGLIETKDSSVVDGIMSLSLSLDEWMRLDSGEIDDIDNINEHTSKILAAHHVNSLDLIHRISNIKRKRGNEPERKHGLLGNNFTVALMVQLRDPLRYFESVGTPMLALIQVKREFFPPKPRNLSEVGNTDEEEDDDCKTIGKVETEKPSEGEGIPQFRITEVHVAGLKTEPAYKKKDWRSWGTSRHQKSGSRWLLANGMGKCEKNPFLKSKPVSTCNAPLTSKVQPTDILWSISYRMYGTGDKRVDLTALNSPIRNPNIIIRNETRRPR